MKTIYKIMIAFIAITMMISTATAFEIEGGTITNNIINWNSFDIASDETAHFTDEDDISNEHTYGQRTIEPAQYEPEGYIPSINPKTSMPISMKTLRLLQGMGI